MKTYGALSLILSTGLAWGMDNNKEEKKEETKSITVNHSGSAKRLYSNKDATALFFYVNQNKNNEQNNMLQTIEQNISKNYSFGEISSLLSNQNLPRYFATTKKKEGKNFCSLYDLKQNGKKIFSMKKGDKPWGFGFAHDGTILFAIFNKVFKTCNLKKREYKITKLNDIIQSIFLSPDSKHALLNVGNMRLYLHYDFENNKITPLSNFRNDSGFTFNDECTYISFFDTSDSMIKLYDTQQHKVVKQHKLDASTTNFHVTYNSSIIFSTDKKNFKLWDTKNDKIIDLVSFETERSIRGVLTPTLRDSNRIYYFYDNQNNKVTVYEVMCNTLFTIEVPEMNGRLVVEEDIDCAVWSGCAKVSLYETDEWKLLDTIYFENKKQIYSQFSPCRNYLIVRFGDILEIYYINTRLRLRFSTSYIDVDGSHYKINSTIIAVKTEEKTLVLYDYKNHKKAEIATEDEITHFMINDSLVVVSAGEKSELFTWDEIVFTEEKKEETKSITVNHSGSAKRVYHSQDTNTLFFYVNQKQNKEENKLLQTIEQNISNNEDYTLEVYDVKSNKIVKISKNYNFEEISSLLFNQYQPRYFATTKKKEDQHFCSVYDLQQNGKKIFTMETGTYPGDFGFANFGSVLFVMFGKLFTTYNLHKQEYKEIKLDDTAQQILLSPCSQHALLYLDTKSPCVHYDFRNNVVTPLAHFQNGSGFLFDGMYGNIAFFDTSDSMIKLYDTTQHKVVKQHKLDARTTDFQVTDLFSIIFSTDKKNFKLWDTYHDTIINLVSFKTEHSVRSFLTPTLRDSNMIYYFYNHQNSKVTVYSVLYNKLFTIEVPEMNGLLVRHDGLSYASWSSNKQLWLYQTDIWELVGIMSFESLKQIYSQFSPCGDYLIVSYLSSEEKTYNTGYVQIYYFEGSFKFQQKFSVPYIDVYGSHYKINSTIVAVKTEEKTLVLYDYKNHKKAEIATEDEITHFMINDLLVVVSAGEESKIFLLDEIVFQPIIIY